MVDTDFSTCTAAREEDLRRLTYIQRTWVEYAARLPERTRYHGRKLVLPPPSKRSAFVQPFILLHRNFIKSYRDLTAYWLRVALYTGKYMTLSFETKLMESSTGYSHGNDLASTRLYPRRHHSPNHRSFLQWCFSKLYGCRLYPSIHRRSRDFFQRTCEWSIWPIIFPHRQYTHWSSISNNHRYFSELSL